MLLLGFCLSKLSPHFLRWHFELLLNFFSHPIFKLPPFIQHVLWPQLFHASIFYSSPSPFSTLKLHPWLKPCSLHMTSKVHRLCWSASGFAVSSSANIIRAICANTHTHTHTQSYRHTFLPSLRLLHLMVVSLPWITPCGLHYLVPETHLLPLCAPVPPRIILVKLSNH